MFSADMTTQRLSTFKIFIALLTYEIDIWVLFNNLGWFYLVHSIFVSHWLLSFSLDTIISSKGFVVILIVDFWGVHLRHVIGNRVFFKKFFFILDFNRISFWTLFLLFNRIINRQVFGHAFRLSLFKDRRDFVQSGRLQLFMVFLSSLNVINLVILFDWLRINLVLFDHMNIILIYLKFSLISFE